MSSEIDEFIYETGFMFDDCLEKVTKIIEFPILQTKDLIQVGVSYVDDGEKLIIINLNFSLIISFRTWSCSVRTLSMASFHLSFSIFYSKL